MVEREYQYKIKYGLMLFGIIFSTFCAVLLGNLVLSNLRLFFTPVIFFYWILFVFSGGVAIAMCFLMVKQWAQVNRITFGQHTMMVPGLGWSTVEFPIEYKDINDILVFENLKHAFSLHIMHKDGKYVIVADLLPSPEAFDEICTLLEKQMQNIRPHFALKTLRYEDIGSKSPEELKMLLEILQAKAGIRQSKESMYSASVEAKTENSISTVTGLIIIFVSVGLFLLFLKFFVLK